ncbi:MAG: NAD(P)H-dependent oxidoreductase [Muribaculaceae bacterium]|nr:NAD(P)H-dependent oxidoreductase [Muribaculaceae bacterium]
MITILYAHPYGKSFNHAILETVKSTLDGQGRDYRVLDLYADGFNPALDASNLQLYSKGETADPLVEKYLDTLMASDEIIMIFPVWWGMMPAIVHGFMDKVFLAGRAYKYAETGALVPDKINIDKTIIFSTSEAPTDCFAPFFKEYFKNNALETVGMKNLEWYNCAQTSHGPAENREKFLELVKEKV